jgi:glyoxylase-like metal-dependent hydrolase (beta-lactamase superfamily II)
MDHHYARFAKSINKNKPNRLEARMEIPKNSFGFSIGNFRCSVIRDGVITVPGKAKQSSTQDFMAPGSTMEAMCLVVKTDKHTILIDTGLGDGGKPKAGNLVQNLRTEGIGSEDIDLVIISHAHGDHISGITNNTGQIAFPNARFIMRKEEWEFWTSDPELKQFKVEEGVRQMFCKTVQEHLMPIKNQIDLIDNETRIIPGIEVIKAPGHTPGNISVAISSNSDELLYTGDLFHHPLQLGEPDLSDVFDFEPEQASRMRTRMLSKIIKPNTLVSAAHFPFPGLGHIIPEGKAWMWKPIE